MKKIITSLIMSALILLTCTLTALPSLATDESAIATGDYITFGKYPQSRVTDEETIAKLNSIDAEIHNYNYENEYDYDPGMCYKDVELDGVKYRGARVGIRVPLAFTETFHGYAPFEFYWFKYEDVRWEVLDAENGIMISDLVIDNQPFNSKIFTDDNEEDKNHNAYCDENFTYYANNYEHSTLRQWLNDDFYNTVFSEEEKNLVIPSEIENSAISEEFSSSNTIDNVYLLSFDEARNNGLYNFNESSRKAYVTDYALSQGADTRHFRYYPNNHEYAKYAGHCKDFCAVWLRTAGCDNSMFGSFSDRTGVIYTFYYFRVNDCCGIRPVIKVDLEKATKNMCHHEYTQQKTEAICLTDGHMYFTCRKCGSKYSYIISCTGHRIDYIPTTATCTEAGLSGGGHCIDCDYYQEPHYDGPLGHKGHGTQYVEPTCTQNGSAWGVECERCGKMLQEPTVLPATGHIDENADGICDRCYTVKETEKPHEPSFAERIRAFFERIIDFFRNLFR